MARLYDFGKPAEDLLEDDFCQREILAMRWAVENHCAVSGTPGLPNVHTVRYEDLCENPTDGFRKIFQKCGVEWHENCQAFLDRSLGAGQDSKEYHGLIRDPLVAANRWREDLSKDDIDAVMKFAAPSAAANLFEDIGQIATAAE